MRGVVVSPKFLKQPRDFVRVLDLYYFLCALRGRSTLLGYLID